MFFGIQKWFLNEVKLENAFVFIIAFAAIFGPAFALLDNYNYHNNPDVYSYLSISKLDFNHNPSRRYRILIPFLAASFNFLFGKLFNLIKPGDFSHPEFSLCFSYFCVNTIIMAFFGLFLHKLLSQLKFGFWISLLCMLAILSSRWVAYFSGLPFIDGLYFLACALIFYGVYSNKINLIYISIFVGFLARESFLLFLPVVLFIPKVNKIKVVLCFLASVFLQIGIRWFVNQNFPVTNGESFTNTQGVLENMSVAIPRLMSFHGLYEMFSILGFWNVFLIPAVIIFFKEPSKYFSLNFLWIWVFLLIVFVHAIISSELARMFFIASPVLAMVLSKGIKQSLSFLKISIDKQ